jgi:hypothetical protein
MTQWRVINWTVSSPSFEIVTVYRKNHCCEAGLDRSAEYAASTRTRTLFVTASDVDIVCPW